MNPTIAGRRVAGGFLSAAVLMCALQNPVRAAEEAPLPERGTVVLGTGERAIVVSQNVTTREYVKAIQQEEGKAPRLVVATINSGLQIARKGDTTCVRIERELVALEDVKTTLGTIQAPLIRVDESPIDCP